MNASKLQPKEQGALPRRGFIKHFLFGAAFSTVLGEEWFATVVADCEPTTPTGGILRIRVSDFPALQTEKGSVRLALNPFSAQGPLGAFYPVLVNRGSGNQFFALRAACTHEGCVVPTFDAGLGASVCPCHQSRFGIDGTRLAGLATSSLARYNVEFDGMDRLCIEIPNLGYSLTGSTRETGVGPRFRLQFATRRSVAYEVRFRESLSDPGTVVPFSTTEGGAADTSVLIGTSASSTATVYLDRTTAGGFYTVAAQVTER